MKLKLITILLIVITLVSFYEVVVIYHKRHRDLSSNYVQVEAGTLTPVRFVIKDLNINLSVYESEIFEGEWQDSEEGISYLKTSPLPGDEGNSIMYGHNWENILGNLKDIQQDAEIEITFSDGESRIFKLQDKFEVTADQTHILSNSDYPKLTIYTCDDFLDSKRLVVTAVPKDALLGNL